MKKTRRLLSMLLATVMVLTLVVPALAADEGTQEATEVTPTQTGGACQTGTTADPIKTIPIEKTVSVSQRGVSLPTETFYFQMIPATVQDLTVDNKRLTVSESSSVEIQPGVELSNPVISLNFDASDSTIAKDVTKNGEFELKFAETFAGQGVYRYYIQEVEKVETKNDDGTTTTTYVPVTNKTTGEDQMNYIEYDTSKYIVDLYMNHDADGNLVVTNTVVQKVDLKYKPNSISFENKINCTTVVIKKKVDGITYQKDEAFTFHIMIPVGGDTITLAEGEKIQCAVYDKTNTLIANAPTTLEVGGANEDAKVSDYNEFTLHDGDYMVIYAPLAMIFKVEEADYSKEGYTTTAIYTETGKFDSDTKTTEDKTIDDTNDADVVEGTNAEDGIVTVKGTANSDGTTVVFKNTRQVSVDTGINLDFLPYVLVLVGALAAAGVWFFFRKRRTVR
jgi:hypothetical protein